MVTSNADIIIDSHRISQSETSEINNADVVNISAVPSAALRR